jgi:DNA ligase (NAD+)
VVDAVLAEPYASAAAYRSAVGEVRSAAAAYYSGPDLVMDDATYDALLARIMATEATHPGWKVDHSPTEEIAAGVAAVGDVEHSTPMLSLDNVFGEEALRKWVARLKRLLDQPVGGFTVEPKIDGLAIAARYVDGRLTLVATRGDGRTGPA